MVASEILSLLKLKGVSVELEPDGSLGLSAAQPLQAEILDLIRNNKKQIICFLREADSEPIGAEIGNDELRISKLRTEFCVQAVQSFTARHEDRDGIVASNDLQRWLQNFGRCGKWNFCLTTGTLAPANQE
jgi:hypothetical protein